MSFVGRGMFKKILLRNDGLLGDLLLDDLLDDLLDVLLDLLADDQAPVQVLVRGGGHHAVELLPAGQLLEAEAEVEDLLAPVQGQRDGLVVDGVDERVVLQGDLLVDLLLGHEVPDGLVQLGDLAQLEVLDHERERAQAGEVGDDVAAVLVEAGARELVGLRRDHALGGVLVSSALADEARSEESRSEGSEGSEWSEADSAEAEWSESAEAEAEAAEAESEAAEGEASQAVHQEERVALLGQQHSAEADEDELSVHG